MGIAGGFMLLVGATFAAAPLLAALGGAKIVAVYVILREGSGRYREQHGEGKFSQHYTVTVLEDVDPLGAHVFVLAGFFAELKPHIGKTFKLATSEYQSLVLLMESIEKHPAYRHLVLALEELHHLSEDSPRDEIDGEIGLRVMQLRAAVRPLADFLVHHDPGRVADAA